VVRQWAAVNALVTVGAAAPLVGDTD